MRSTYLALTAARYTFKSKTKPKPKSPATHMPTSQLRTPPTWAANFPPSSARPSPISLPGLTPASTTTVRRVLEENNRGYDMWQEERRCESSWSLLSQSLSLWPSGES
jgi:hypothetical protein